MLQDLNHSSPPLFPPVLKHIPVSYKVTQLHRQTSLGSLDNICKRLQIFLKKSPPFSFKKREFKDNIEFLISVFQYQNNFSLEADCSGFVPAQIHLGSLNSDNILSLMKNIQNYPNPLSQGIQNMQNLLQKAKKIRATEERAQQTCIQMQQRQLQKHHKLKAPGDIFKGFQPLDIIYIKSQPHNEAKLDFKAKYHGPCVILSVHPKSEHLNIYGLLSGEVHTKNYKQVRAAFIKNTFNLPLFPHLGSQVQFKMIHPSDTVKAQDNIQDILQNSTNIILNTHKLMLFLSQLLPNYKQTENHLRTIQLSLDEDDNDGHDDGNEDNNDQNVNDADDPHDDDDENDDGQITIYRKPTVRFQDAHNHDDNDDHNDDDDDHDDHDDPVLHIQAPTNEDLLPDQPDQSQKKESQIKLTRKKVLPAELSRPAKYTLRKNPKKKIPFDV